MKTSRVASEVVILSGYPRGESGVGRVIAYLIEQAQKENLSVRFVARQRYDINLRKMLKIGFFHFLRSACLVMWSEFVFAWAVSRLIKSKASIVLIHPQAIGFRRVLSLIQRRLAPTWLYVMDSSFFCVRSYNQLNPLEGSCFKCLQPAFQATCQPFPIVDPWAYQFADKLVGLVEDGKLFFLTQNVKQTQLVRQKFGSSPRVEQIGLWAVDWNNTDFLPETFGKNRRFDVVFHGNPFDAKGFSWVLALARLLPTHSFLFPFECPPSKESLPNCEFSPMSWNTGLFYYAQLAKAVLLPSLWSAPIEGALIKSLQCSSSVVVVDEISAFSAELSDDLIFRLSLNLEKAAQQLKDVLIDGQAKNRETIDAWLSEFSKINRPVFHHLYSIVSN